MVEIVGVVLVGVIALVEVWVFVLFIHDRYSEAKEKPKPKPKKKAAKRR